MDYAELAKDKKLLISDDGTDDYSMSQSAMTTQQRQETDVPTFSTQGLAA